MVSPPVSSLKMRANKTTLEKAVTVLRLLEGGEETYATAESTQKKSGLVAGPSSEFLVTAFIHLLYVI